MAWGGFYDVRIGDPSLPSCSEVTELPARERTDVLKVIVLDAEKGPLIGEKPVTLSRMTCYGRLNLVPVYHGSQFCKFRGGF